MAVTPQAQPQAAPREIPGPFDLLWRWLNSLPVAIVVMLLLAILSAIGTMVPQAHLAQPPAGLTFPQFLDQRYGPARSQLIQFLGWHQIYFTWYYFALMLWLSVSAVICNITRFQRTITQWKAPPLNRDSAFFIANPKGHALDGAAPGGLDRLEATLRQLRFRVVRGEFRGAPVLYADRGYLRKWALVLLHVAILVLLTGGIGGAIFGSKGMVRAADGQTQDLTIARDLNKHMLVKKWLATLPPLVYTLQQTNFRIDYDTKIFTASDVKENVPPELQEYYSYFVRQFVSTLAVTHNGVTTGPEEVSVNHPLTSEKMTFYQSGYSQLGYVSVDFGGGRVAEFPAPAEVQLALTSEGVMLGEMAAATGRPTADAAFILEQVKAGDLYAAGQKTGYVGPLTIAHLLDQRTGEQSSVLLTPEQGFATLLGGQPVTVRMSRKVENYSDFSYQRDPGLPILGLGWVLLVIGIAAALYTPFTQVQAREEASRSLLVVLGQNSQRDEPLPQRLRAILMHEA